LEIDWPTVISAASSAFVGATTTGILIRLLVTRYISDNDQKHAASQVGIKEISKELSELNTEVKVILARIADTMKLQGQVTEHDRSIAIMQKGDEKIEKDLNHLHSNVRTMKERIIEHDAKLLLITRKEGTNA